MFEMSDKQIEEWRRKCLALVGTEVGGEEVLSAAGFRRGGATASYMASKAGGGLLYAGVRMMGKRKAGGLPDKVMLAVTPRRLYAYKLKVGRDYRLGDEVGAWDRDGLKVSTDGSGGMTALTIESPASGEKATLVGISVKDDAVSGELMAVLQAEAPTGNTGA